MRLYGSRSTTYISIDRSDASLDLLSKARVDLLCNTSIHTIFWPRRVHLYKVM